MTARGRARAEPRRPAPARLAEGARTPYRRPRPNDHGAPFDVPPAERRARAAAECGGDGAEGYRAGLVDDPARAVRGLVGEPAQCRADPADVAVRDVDGVGSRADDALQRRLPAQHAP